MYRKAWCTCKPVVLLNKRIAVLTVSLPSPSSLLELPNYCGPVTVPPPWGIDHHTGDNVPYSLSSLSEKTRKSNRLQKSLQRQHFLLSYLRPWVLVRPGLEPAASRSADRRLSNWANWAAVAYLQILMLVAPRLLVIIRNILGRLGFVPLGTLVRNRHDSTLSSALDW